MFFARMTWHCSFIPLYHNGREFFTKGRIAYLFLIHMGLVQLSYSRIRTK